MSPQQQAGVYLAVAMSIAGSSVVAGKLMVVTMPIFLAAELGIVASLVFLGPLALTQRHRPPCLDRKTHVLLLLQAVFGVVLYRVFTFWGVQYTTATASGLLSSASPPLIALMAFALLREPLPVARIAGVLSVSAGILAVNLEPFFREALPGVAVVQGNCLILLAVFSEAVFSVISKAACRPMTAMFRTAMVSCYAALCLLPLAVHDALTYDFSAMTRWSVICIGYYGFFVSFLSYVFWFKGIALLPAGVAASFTGFVPITALFLSWLILHEDITTAHLMGLGFVLLGVYFSYVASCQGSFF